MKGGDSQLRLTDPPTLLPSSGHTRLDGGASPCPYSRVTEGVSGLCPDSVLPPYKVLNVGCLCLNYAFSTRPKDTGPKLSMMVIHLMQLHFHKWDWDAPDLAFSLGSWPESAILFELWPSKDSITQRPILTSFLGPWNLCVINDCVITWVTSLSSQANPVSKKKNKNKTTTNTCYITALDILLLIKYWFQI